MKNSIKIIFLLFLESSINLKNRKYMIEIWKTVIIKGETYDNYQVSNLGRLMSLNYRGTGRAELMNPGKLKDGYLIVVLTKDRKRHTYTVHRLIAETFLPNPNNLPEVNHKDENKENNFVGTPENDYKDGNLEWCDSKDNCNYGTRNERIAKAKSKPVLQFTLTGEFIREWPSTMECKRNGFNQGNISSCCLGERKSADGYIWKYKDKE